MAGQDGRAGGANGACQGIPPAQGYLAVFFERVWVCHLGENDVSGEWRLRLAPVTAETKP